MTAWDVGPDPTFSNRLKDRLADLRLRVDLNEITSAADFRDALEADGEFRLGDPRVRAACLHAGLGRWIL